MGAGIWPPYRMNRADLPMFGTGMINKKTTAVRFIPVPGKKAGDRVEFGGLFGRAPIMRVSPYSSEAFIARGGRIPAPLQSLKN